LLFAAESVNRVHDQSALHGYETANARIAAFELLSHQTVGHAGHSGTAIAVQAGAEKSQLAQLRNQMHRESGFAAVLFDNRNNFVFDEFARGLPDEFFLVIELR